MIDGYSICPTTSLSGIAIAREVALLFRSFGGRHTGPAEALTIIFQPRVAVVVTLAVRGALLDCSIVELEFGLKWESTA